MDLTAIRIANARAAIERSGGPNAVARKMGYANSSFLVQMFGPKPSRRPTETFVRRLEEALHLPHASLDVDHSKTRAPAVSEKQVKKAREVVPLDADQLTASMLLVDKLAMESKVQLTRERFASLVTMCYEDATERGGVARESHIRRVIELMV